MILDVDVKKIDVTVPTVTLKLDAETCYTLSLVFSELASALGRAERSYKARKRFLEDEPARKAKAENLRAEITRRDLEIGSLPFREAVKVLRAEFNESWDGMEFLLREIRQEARKAARLERDMEIERLSKDGLGAGDIAKVAGLGVGTVRNILTRLRKAAAPPEPEESRAACLSA